MKECPHTSGPCSFSTDLLSVNYNETRLIMQITTNKVLGKYKLKNYILFSLSGFSQWVSEKEDDKLILITIEEM